MFRAKRKSLLHRLGLIYCLLFCSNALRINLQMSSLYTSLAGEELGSLFNSIHVSSTPQLLKILNYPTFDFVSIYNYVVPAEELVDHFVESLRGEDLDKVLPIHKVQKVASLHAKFLQSLDGSNPWDITIATKRFIPAYFLPLDRLKVLNQMSKQINRIQSYDFCATLLNPAPEGKTQIDISTYFQDERWIIFNEYCIRHLEDHTLTYRLPEPSFLNVLRATLLYVMEIGKNRTLGENLKEIAFATYPEFGASLGSAFKWLAQGTFSQRSLAFQTLYDHLELLRDKKLALLFKLELTTYALNHHLGKSVDYALKIFKEQSPEDISPFWSQTLLNLLGPGYVPHLSSPWMRLSEESTISLHLPERFAPEKAREERWRARHTRMVTKNNMHIVDPMIVPHVYVNARHGDKLLSQHLIELSQDMLVVGELIRKAPASGVLTFNCRDLEPQTYSLFWIGMIYAYALHDHPLPVLSPDFWSLSISSYHNCFDPLHDRKGLRNIVRVTHNILYAWNLGFIVPHYNLASSNVY